MCTYRSYHMNKLVVVDWDHAVKAGGEEKGSWSTQWKARPHSEPPPWVWRQKSGRFTWRKVLAQNSSSALDMLCDLKPQFSPSVKWQSASYGHTEDYR